ncbi:hypothetical protein [Palleronia pelagia]|uniref:Transferrin-binding protein B C-lobe/N-lobe beta barrel domain-containing protein n=1 Tax=Palleronia pelagia TaxID=387096 RepID=A0A1H8GRH6_9RHOB|nr:hypothetical protein [Palleronia pelagia]SEN46711.1 hypothetical protein SAMN04488011_104186 [Palleronia pelagia]
MFRIPLSIALAAVLSLAACGGPNPFNAPEEETDGGTDGGTGGDDGTPIQSDRGLPPGTSSPSPDNAIVRYEANDSAGGGGFAEGIEYDRATDTFTVDNLAFDGDNTYARGTAVSSLGPFAVYESDVTTTDPVTGNVIDTFPYRAIYGVSRTGQTEFAIVRTGGYLNYGFGGFVYQRNAEDAAGNPVTLDLPTEGDAEYAGDYAGVRIFDGKGGLEYVTGDASMLIDFKDFNDSQAGVLLRVRNRRLYDVNGNDITSAYLDALEADNADLIRPSATDGSGNEVLASIGSRVNPNVADANGEIVQEIFARYSETDGTSFEAGDGQYYAIMSGQNASEIVGVLVMEGADARSDATFQETGGFIVYRQ